MCNIDLCVIIMDSLIYEWSTITEYRLILFGIWCLTPLSTIYHLPMLYFDTRPTCPASIYKDLETHLNLQSEI